MKLAKKEESKFKGICCDFRLQPIVDNKQNFQGWHEMLYCPQMMSGRFKVDEFFALMSPKEKVDFDIYALTQASELQKYNLTDRISINISPLSLCNDRFLNHLSSLNHNKQIDLNSICLEIVETDFLRELPVKYINNIIELRKQGMWIALDDFGCGYAHWQLLKLGLVDVIKTINSNVSKTKITNEFLVGLSAFAKSQGAITVLEGIEAYEDFDMGLLLGYQYFQGYFFNSF